MGMTYRVILFLVSFIRKWQAFELTHDVVSAKAGCVLPDTQIWRGCSRSLGIKPFSLHSRWCPRISSFRGCRRSAPNAMRATSRGKLSRRVGLYCQGAVEVSNGNYFHHLDRSFTMIKLSSGSCHYSAGACPETLTREVRLYKVA